VDEVFIPSRRVERAGDQFSNSLKSQDATTTATNRCLEREIRVAMAATFHSSWKNTENRQRRIGCKFSPL
jgi:hypothetical protein